MNKLSIGIVGLTGKMGQRVKNLLDIDSYAICSGGVSSSSNVKDFENIVERSDIVIDFSHNDATELAVKVCQNNKKPLVSGTTALSNQCIDAIKSAANDIPIMHASNFCVSIYLMSRFIADVAKILPDADIDILETHHKMKKDAPSGTALFLKNSMEKDNINMISRRCGNCVGEHIVSFFSEDEVLSITHQAFNRDIFARGAINVAKWLVQQPSGLYSMGDYVCSNLKK